MADSRKALTGSCHCGATRYVAFLTLPHPHNQSNPPERGSQEVYRCNCTTCHKINFFHVRPADTTNDFLLISPLEPEKELSNYNCFRKSLDFYFCKTCGVRCFIFGGTGEVVEMDLAEIGAPGYTEKGKLTKVWRAKKDGGHPEWGTYLSINGNSIDSSQTEVFDMRVLTEEKKVSYLDCLTEPGEEAEKERWDRPQKGGCY